MGLGLSRVSPAEAGASTSGAVKPPANGMASGTPAATPASTAVAGARGATAATGTSASTSTRPPVAAPRHVIVDVHCDLAESRAAHSTTMYPSEELVVRRGAPLVLCVVTDATVTEADIAATQPVVIMTTGGIEYEARVCTAAPTKEDAWGVVVDRCAGTNVTVSVHIPPLAPVGEYSATVRLTQPPGVAVVQHKLKTRVLVFFNPWCERDGVFMASAEERNEYVLAEDGLIWTGSSAKLRPRPWNFGQFNNKSVSAALKLLSMVGVGRRANPVDVAREMSALVNANDDGGVLVGNWSGDYEDGIKPTAWTGSAPILKQFVDTGRSVSYGQCWVFSGVLTSVMRCMGIPARSVTNFDSAHDAEANGTIDKYVDRAGNPIPGRNADSVWNFHVWNDVWMRRPDLPPGNDGWQAIDATPQELSGGRYATGPASLAMVRSGAGGKYDAGFVTSEVNADVRTFVQLPDGSFKLAKVDTKQVGRFISTKAVGKAERMDVTSLYKHPEGTPLERAAALNATQTAEQSAQSAAPKPSSITLKLTASKTFAGDPLTLTCNATLADAVKEPRALTVTMSAQLRRYTGQAIGDPLVFTSKISLTPQSRTGSALAVISESGYRAALRDHFSVDVSACALCEQASEVLFESLQAHVLVPEVDMRTDTPLVRVRQPSKAIIRFTNPLSVPLTNVRVSVEGLSLTKTQTQTHATLAPKDVLEASFDIEPKEGGCKVLVATLSSDQLDDIHGRREIEVVSRG